ncbi:hypothetical protein RRF57_002106 [Xylaria bambusicola]|uniref:Uncharacterized protein n=1 Tax=Xylaria bambusicola TaxID=326684 RepID=A0AAN7Z6N9_9PEZI
MDAGSKLSSTLAKNRGRVVLKVHVEGRGVGKVVAARRAVCDGATDEEYVARASWREMRDRAG